MASQSSLSVAKLLTGITGVVTGGEQGGAAGAKTYQASGKTDSGAGAATIKVEGTTDGISWDTIGTISLTLATTRSSDGFTSYDRYLKVRGNVTAISGTGASVNLNMSF